MFAVMSVQPQQRLRAWLNLLPDLPRGLVTSAYRLLNGPLPKATCDHLRRDPDYDRTGSLFYQPRGRMICPAPAWRRALREAGAMKICCWTVAAVYRRKRAARIAA